MSVVRELLAAIEADPRDEAAQLVIADHLQAEGDPRGDLIVLDHADRRGLLATPEAIEHLLALAAEYSFPRAAPEDPPLRWEALDERRVEAWHAGVRYELAPDGDHWTLHVDRDDDIAYEELDLPAALDARHLVIVGDVIRAGSPFDDDLRFELDGIALPMYDGGPLRCYRLPLAYLIPRGHLRNRFGLAARDYHRWHALWRRLGAMQPVADEC